MTFFNNNISQLAITAFMDWFSKLSIEKYQTVSVSGDDVYVQRKVIPVPCQWATREKFVEIMRSSSARRAMDSNLNNTVEMQWILPRISVNLDALTYDSARRLVKTQQIDNISNSVNSKSSVYSPAPYNLNLEVSTISRNIDENFQLMEQIIPYFSPAMSLNLKIQPNGVPESIPIVLNSVSIDNPIDIPENDERIFTNSYSFTMKLNYFTPNKTQFLINNMSINMLNGVQVSKIDKIYIDYLNIIQDKFSNYVKNATLPVPSIHVGLPTTSTYTPTDYKFGEEQAMVSAVLEALGDPQVIALHDTIAQTITLVTPGISGTNNIDLQDNIKIFFRLNDEDTIYEYNYPINIITSNVQSIHYWVSIGTKTDNKQLIVYFYQVI